jgi:hypothetical protein
MRVIAVLVTLAALAGCGGSGGPAAAVPLREYQGLADGPLVLDAGQDASLLPQLQQAMAGRVLYLGLFHRFDTGARQLLLQDGQVVGSSLAGVEAQDGPWNSVDGWLTLDGATADYREPLSRIPPATTQLMLRGTFEHAGLEAQVAALEALPFDPARPVAATSAGTVTVHWQLSGLFNGTQFDAHFTQTVHVVAVDANTA